MFTESALATLEECCPDAKKLHPDAESFEKHCPVTWDNGYWFHPSDPAVLDAKRQVKPEKESVSVKVKETTQLWTIVRHAIRQINVLDLDNRDDRAHTALQQMMTEPKELANERYQLKVAHFDTIERTSFGHVLQPFEQLSNRRMRM